MIKRIKNIFIALFNGASLYLKISFWNKVRSPLIFKIERLFLFCKPEDKYHIITFYNYISKINAHMSKFYWEELKKDDFWNELRFFIIYLPFSFIIGILKKNIMFFRIFWILITDFLIFGFKKTIGQKKWHKVFKQFFYVLLFMQFLYFLKISLYFKLVIFGLAIYGNWKEYFNIMRKEKNNPEFKDNFKGWVIYGIRSLIGFFVEDHKLQGRCDYLMRAGDKEFLKYKRLYNIYFLLELFFWKKEIEINFKKFKIW